MKLNEIVEALTLKQAKPLVKLQKEKYEEIPERIFQVHRDLFGDEDHRIYYNLNGEKENFIESANKNVGEKKAFSIDKLIHKVNVVLAQDGYVVDDFNNNKAYKFIDINTDKGKMIWSKIPEANKKDETQYKVKGHLVYIKKNEFSITKLLGKEPQLQKEYEAYYQKAQSKNKNGIKILSENPDDYLIVISRHAYDIGGASTDRQWYSCMNLDDGVNKRYVKYDIAGGNLVSYLIKKNDTNIKDPIARVLVKKYYKRNGKNTDFILYPEQTCYSEVHSPIIEKYKETIQKIFIDEQKDTMDKDVLYKFMYTKQYLDNNTKEEILLNKEGNEGLLPETIDKIKSCINDFNEHYKKMYDSVIKDFPKEKLLKIEGTKKDITEETEQVLDSHTKQNVIKYFKLGLKQGKWWSGAFDTEKYAKELTQDIKDFNVVFSPITTLKKSVYSSKNTISISVYLRNQFPIDHEEKSSVDVNREYDITAYVPTRDYAKEIRKYLKDYTESIYVEESGSAKNRKYTLKISLSPIAVITIDKKKIIEKFDEELNKKNLKPDFDSSMARSLIDEDYIHTDGNLNKPIDGVEEFEHDDKFVNFILDNTNVFSAVEAVVDFIIKQLKKGKYSIDEILPEDNLKRKPFKEVLNDLAKEIGYDPNDITYNEMNTIINYVMDEEDGKIPEKVVNFFSKLEDETTENGDASRTLLILKKIGKQHPSLAKDISNFDDGEKREMSKAEIANRIYTLVKAYQASVKVKKGEKEKKIEENVSTIYNKIHSLKRII